MCLGSPESKKTKNRILKRIKLVTIQQELVEIASGYTVAMGATNMITRRAPIRVRISQLGPKRIPESFVKYR